MSVAKLPKISYNLADIGAKLFSIDVIYETCDNRVRAVSDKSCQESYMGAEIDGETEEELQGVSCDEKVMGAM